MTREERKKSNANAERIGRAQARARARERLVAQINALTRRADTLRGQAQGLDFAGQALEVELEALDREVG